jgi:hypothetical protein
MRTFIFGVCRDGIEIRRGERRIGVAGTCKAMRALAEKLNFTDDDIVMFSSSMDFPGECTKNKRVLVLVEKLAGVR